MPHKSEQNGISTVPSAQGILNAVAAPIAVLDETGAIVATNRAWRNFGQANQARDASHIGVNYLEVCACAIGGDAPCAKAAAAGIRSVLSGGGNFSLEYPCHSPEEQRWFQLQVTHLEHSGAAHAVVMHHDITSRVLIEQEKQSYLAKAERHQVQMRSLAAAAAKIVAASTVEATLQEIADQARAIIGAHWAAIQTTSYGLWPEPFTALSLSDQCRRGSALAISTAAAKVYMSVLQSSCPVRLRASELYSHSGSHLVQDPARALLQPVGILAVPLVGAQGGAMGALILSDKDHGEFTSDDEDLLTQLAQIAPLAIENAALVQVLRGAKERLLTTQEHASVGICETDINGRLVMVNAWLVAMLGYSRSELLDMNIFDLADLESSTNERSLYQQHIAGDPSSYTLEQCYIRKNNAPAWFTVSADAVLDEQGRFRYSVRVFQPLDQLAILHPMPNNDRL